MFAGGTSYNKLKTNLRLAVNRLKLLEKKKTELAQKARKEIADYIANGKDERAKIRVEHIIREDYMVEAMEVVEMYCDLLLARFGLLQQMKTLDDGLAEAISSLLWVAPRLTSDIAEMKVIADQLTMKYGKQYAQACRENAVGTVNAKLMQKLSPQAPPAILVERYLIEIAKSHNVPYEPDPEVMRQDEVSVAEAILIDFNENKGGAYPGMPQPGPTYPPPPGFNIPPGGPPPPFVPFSYPQTKPGGGSGGGGCLPPPLPSVPPSNPYPPVPDKGSEGQYSGPPADFMPPDDMVPSYDSVTRQQPNQQLAQFKPTPAPRTGPADTLPELPSVPSGSLAGDDAPSGSTGGDDVDFDDLTRRFEELKKRK